MTTYNLTPNDGGGTDVALTFSAQPVTFLARVMMLLMSGMTKGLARIMEQDMDDARRHAEAQAEA